MQLVSSFKLKPDKPTSLEMSVIRKDVVHSKKKKKKKKKKRKKAQYAEMFKTRIVNLINRWYA